MAAPPTTLATGVRATVPLRTVTATRYVTALREGGSMPGLVEADDDGLYVVKFRGAGQGPRVLVAELIAGELGRALGLLVPEIVLVEIDPALAPAEPDSEIQELLARSPGLNVGLDFLPGALAYRPTTDVDPDLAADIVWFDGLITNVDRTARNVNLLMWGNRLWLIDHGAALYIHFTWRDPAAHARRPFPRIAEHVLLPHASSIAAADERLAPLVTRETLEGIVAAVPDAWLLDGAGTMGQPAEHRQAYVDYLVERLRGPRPFVEEADRARRT
ncbi:MAG: HipA family kinase [Candidatus Limnocylindrales bacterium]